MIVFSTNVVVKLRINPTKREADSA